MPCRRRRGSRDVRASGSISGLLASYKWLMGDMGLGFLYVKEDLLGRLEKPIRISPAERGWYHIFPYDPPGNTVMDWSVSLSAGGHFEVGTVSNTTAACLSYSLDYIQQLGVEKIQAHRQPLLRRLQTECRGWFQPLTPSTALRLSWLSRKRTPGYRRAAETCAHRHRRLSPPHPHLAFRL